MFSPKGKLKDESYGEEQYGVNVRLEPTNGEAQVDIVLVHGLNGDALRTWTHPDTGKCWATDTGFWKPKDLESLRIMTFGYNANLFAEFCTERIIDHANKLLQNLKVKRRRCKDRPIIFVGHSLGGLVIKRALLLSLISSDKSIVDSTFAIVFMGTPHLGADLAKLASIAQKLASAVKLQSHSGNLPAEIDMFSNTTSDLNREFKDTALRFKIVSYHETKETRIPLPPGSCLIVEPQSAMMNHPSEDSIAWPVAHRELSKFESADKQRFKEFHEQFEALVDDAIEEKEKKARAVSLEQRLGNLSVPLPDQAQAQGNSVYS